MVFLVAMLKKIPLRKEGETSGGDEPQLNVAELPAGDDAPSATPAAANEGAAAALKPAKDDGTDGKPSAGTGVEAGTGAGTKPSSATAENEDGYIEVNGGDAKATVAVETGGESKG